MDLNLPHLIPKCLNALCYAVKERLRRWTRPDSQSLALNAVLDLTRPKSELVLENAVLAENTHPFENPSLRMDDPLGLYGLMGRSLSG